MTTQDWTSIFQSLVEELGRGDSWSIEFDDSIRPKDPDHGWKEYMKNAFAWFECSKCKRKWPSSRVIVLFHMRLSEKQGTVKVRCFRQECKKCSSASMEEPSFTPENLDILLEKLMEKIRVKCYHENRGPQNKPFHAQDMKSPHEPAHCEACLLGVCNRQ